MANNNVSSNSSNFPEIETKPTIKIDSLPSPVTKNTLKVSSKLKRKWPGKMIKIPNVLNEISAEIMKDKQIEEEEEQSDGTVCFGDCAVGVFAVKGKKKFMEDTHKIFASSDGAQAFYGVYDGHGGSKAAEFVAENLHLNILAMLEIYSENNVSKEEAVKAAYLITDEAFLNQGIVSGSCCVTAVIEGNEMVISNLGDCRAVLCKGGNAEAVTTDHRPSRDDERIRIQDKGGYVDFHRGAFRIHGSLAVSRSIGDAHMKDWVIAEPDTKVIKLTSDMEYLVLASDGLWAEVGNQEAVSIVKQATSPKSPFSLAKLKRVFQPTAHGVLIGQQKPDEHELCFGNGIPSCWKRKQMKMKTLASSNENEFLIEKPVNNGDGLVAACKELVNLAVARGCLDDITVMIVDLSHYKV